MDLNKLTTIEEIFTAELITASGVAYSRIFDVGKLDGLASLQITLADAGTGQFQVVSSNDEDALVAAFVIVNGYADIVTAFTAGTAIYTFTPPAVGRMAIKVTETAGGVATITVTAILALK